MKMNAREGESLGALLLAHRRRLDPHITALGDFARRPDRVGKPVTQEELAEAVGVTRVWYAKLERRVDVKASAGLVSRLADVLMLDDAERNALFHAAIPVLRTPLRLDNPGVIHQLRSWRRYPPKRRIEAENSQMTAIAKETPKSGIDVIGEMPWGTHFCLLYDTKEDLLDTLSAYCKAGLEGGEFCLWAVASPFTIDEAIFALKALVPDVERYFEDGSLEIVSARDWYTQGGTFDPKRLMSGLHEKLARASARGYPGIRATGDTSWLEKEDWKEFCEYEERLNEAVVSQRLAVLCTYPIASCGAVEMIDVTRTHQFAIARQQQDWYYGSRTSRTRAKPSST
jgi:transcriptional regulator with XRE-family HTH domain